MQLLYYQLSSVASSTLSAASVHSDAAVALATALAVITAFNFVTGRLPLRQRVDRTFRIIVFDAQIGGQYPNLAVGINIAPWQVGVQRPVLRDEEIVELRAGVDVDPLALRPLSRGAVTTHQSINFRRMGGGNLKMPPSWEIRFPGTDDDADRRRRPRILGASCERYLCSDWTPGS